MPLLLLGLWLPVTGELSVWGVLRTWSHSPERVVLYCAVMFVAAIVFSSMVSPRDRRPMAVVAAITLVGLIGAIVAARGLGTPGSGAAVLLVALALVGLGAWAAPMEWAQIQGGMRARIDPPIWRQLMVVVGVTDLWFTGIVSFWVALGILVVAGLALVISVRIGTSRPSRTDASGS